MSHKTKLFTILLTSLISLSAFAAASSSSASSNQRPLYEIVDVFSRDESLSSWAEREKTFNPATWLAVACAGRKKAIVSIEDGHFFVSLVRTKNETITQEEMQKLGIDNMLRLVADRKNLMNSIASGGNPPNEPAEKLFIASLIFDKTNVHVKTELQKENGDTYIHKSYRRLADNKGVLCIEISSKDPKIAMNSTYTDEMPEEKLQAMALDWRDKKTENKDAIIIFFDYRKWRERVSSLCIIS